MVPWMVSDICLRTMIPKYFEDNGKLSTIYSENNKNDAYEMIK